MPETPAPPGAADPAFVAPHPGVKEMPRWNTGTLVEPPRFTWKNWVAMIGPALVLAGASIGGGEWLVGPLVTARYGGALMWLALLSILGQLIYNLEVSRYALYTGEPIFTGKFRTLPGPVFWLLIYAILDCGAFFPYLAANAAAPVGAMIVGHVLSPEEPWKTVNLFGNEFVMLQKHLQLSIAYVLFLIAFIPMFLGGKIYNSIKGLMAIKVVVVLTFLLFLAIFFTNGRIWAEILTGFVKFGTVPIERGEDLNGNGVLDPGEDWDSDGNLDVVETQRKDGSFDDIDGDGIRDGNNVDNIFISLWEGRGIPKLDLTLIAYLAAFAAIAGQGGLNNAPVSNYTRDQGWGMGHHVGAIPSVVKGQHITLSHVGTVFNPTPDTIPRWRKWYRHVMRDQMVIWAPACILGIALPSMLSVAFLRRGTQADNWTAASMTADGIANRVSEIWGAGVGNIFWYLTLSCGALVLVPAISATIDGFCRRWVDVIWTANPKLRQWDTNKIGKLYFAVMMIYLIFGLIMLPLPPGNLVKFATNLMNFALGFSALHTVVVNQIMLPKPIRPHWIIQTLLTLAGIFFLILASLTFLDFIGYI